MSFLSIEVKGLKEFQDYMTNLNKGQRKVIRQEFAEAAGEVVNKMKKDVPVDQARLKSSITYKMISDTELEIMAQSAYAPYVEFGTKKNFRADSEVQGYANTFKGKTGISDVDPLVALTAWVRRKGLAATYSTKVYNIRSKSGKRNSRTKAEADREKQTAYAIFWSIKKKGIKAQPFFFRSASGTSRITELQKAIAQRLETGIKALIGD